MRAIVSMALVGSVLAAEPVGTVPTDATPSTSKAGGWMPFAQGGLETGAKFAQQGADTGLRFFTDPNFNFGSEGAAYQESTAETKSLFGGLAGAEPAAEAPPPAEAAPEKAGWQQYANTGTSTGGSFAAQGADTGLRFFTDPNFSFQKEGQAYRDHGAATQAEFNALGDEEAESPPVLETATQTVPETAPALEAAPAPVLKSVAEPAAGAPAAGIPTPAGGWQPFAKEGISTGTSFAAQGADTAFRFFTDPKFSFQKEGEAYQEHGAATKDSFGALSGAIAQAPSDAVPEKAGWQDFMKQGLATGGDFASQGGDTAMHFATDPNFDFQKEGSAYQESGAATQAKFDSLSAPEKSDQAPTDATPSTSKAGGWMPFAQGGLETGAKFAQQGADTGLRFFTDPNFNFGSEGAAYQESTAETKSLFGGLAGAEPAAEAPPPAEAAPEKAGWQQYANTGTSTGGSFAAQGADTGLRFFTDPNFSFQKEGQAYRDHGAATQAEFNALGDEEAESPPVLETATQTVPETAPALEAAPAPVLKSVAEPAAGAPAAGIPTPAGGWQPFAKEGISTGTSFAAQGADTAFRFFTDPKFSFQKEGEAYQEHGAATKDSFGALSGAIAQAPSDAVPEKAGWQDFMKQGLATGGDFASQGGDTAMHFATDPNFDFQKEGSAYQESGAATQAKFDSLSAPEKSDQAPTDATPSTSKAGGWMPFAQGGLETGAKFAQQGADTGLRFFTDPNFNFGSEGAAYQESTAETKSLFGGLAGADPAAEAPPPAEAAPEKAGWQQYANTGTSTGGSFAAQGADTGLRFFTDPNFSFQKEGQAYRDHGAATQAEFNALGDEEAESPPVLETATQTVPETAPALEAAPAPVLKSVAEPAAGAPAAGIPTPAGGWQPFAKEGISTGTSFAAQGADTAFRFFTDPKFSFQKEGEAYQEHGAATKDSFGALSGAIAQAPSDAVPEKAGWQDFMKQGLATGGDFASQGGDTAMHFATDPNFDFQKEGSAYQESGAATQAKFDSLSAPEKSDQAPTDATPSTSKAGGWMPFAQGGLETGAKFAQQGADTGLRFFTDPNFNFGSEGAAYQESTAETKSLFGGLAGAEPAAEAPPPAEAAPEKAGWQQYANTGTSTGGSFAAQGADTGLRFFTDPNFSFQKEGQAYRDHGAATQAEFNALGDEEAESPPVLETATQTVPETAPALEAAPAPVLKSVAEPAAGAPAAGIPTPAGGWQPFAKEGISTGTSFAAQGADTAFRFFTDPKFSFQKEGEAYQEHGAATKDSFGALSGAIAQAPSDAVPEKAGWQDFMKQGLATGGDFASQGGDTAMHFATDPNFDFQKEGSAYQESGAATQAKFDSLSAPEKSGEATADGAGALPTHSWQDFMHTGIDTGVAYALAGAATAEDYGTGTADGSVATDRFGKLSQTTTDNFATLAGGEAQPATTPAGAVKSTAEAQPATDASAAAPSSAAQPSLHTWQELMHAGINTGVAYAQAGADTADELSQGKGDGASSAHRFTDLTQDAVHEFSVLTGLTADDAAAPAAAAAPAGAALRMAPLAAQHGAVGPSFGSVAVLALLLAGIAALVTRRIKARYEASSQGHYLPQKDEDEV